jgi:hypothetical protein
MAIVAILVTISAGGYSAIRAKATDGVCTSHMRSLHGSLSAYLADNERWPQPPEGIMDDKEEKLWEWWINELEPYGGRQKFWCCPTHIEVFARGRSADELPKYVGSFIPANFDPHPQAPYKYPQPWLMERGDFHGRGAKLLMSDGAIDALPPKATGGRTR